MSAETVLDSWSISKKKFCLSKEKKIKEYDNGDGEFSGSKVMKKNVI